MGNIAVDLSSASHNMTSNETLERLVRDQDFFNKCYGRPTFKTFVQSHVTILCSWAAATCGFLYGFDQGLVNVTLIIDEFLIAFPEVDSNQNSRAAFWKGLVTAIFELGAVLGALQSAFFCNQFSRRYTIILAVAWYLVGSILQAAAQNYTMLVFGRLIAGVGVGGASMIAPLYISEIAQPSMRGALYTLQQWMLILGIVVAYYTTYGARNIDSYWSWRTAFVVQFIPGLILLGIVAVLPFSPRWLGMQMRDHECLETIAKLRGLPQSDSRVLAEWVNIRAEVQVHKRLASHGSTEEETNEVNIRGIAVKPTFLCRIKQESRTWRLCFTKQYIKPIYIGIVLNAFQQWVGVNGFTYYSNTLFEQLGYGYEARLNLGGLLSITQLIGSTVPIFIIDRVGRRPLLLFGTFMLCSCHIINAAVIGISYTDWAQHGSSARAGTAFMFIFMFCFEISWGPIAWGLPSEILPSIIRAEGMAMSAASNWLNNFIVGVIVPSLVAAAPYGSFALFAGTSFLALCWVFLCVPETRGRSLESSDGGLRGDGLDDGESRRTDEVVLQILRELVQDARETEDEPQEVLGSRSKEA